MPVRKAITEKDGVYFITCINWLALFNETGMQDIYPIKHYADIYEEL
jgi:hypothetical protein